MFSQPTNFQHHALIPPATMPDTPKSWASYELIGDKSPIASSDCRHFWVYILSCCSIFLNQILLLYLLPIVQKFVEICCLLLFSSFFLWFHILRKSLYYYVCKQYTKFKWNTLHWFWMKACKFFSLQKLAFLPPHFRKILFNFASDYLLSS